MVGQRQVVRNHYRGCPVGFLLVSRLNGTARINWVTTTARWAFRDGLGGEPPAYFQGRGRGLLRLWWQRQVVPARRLGRAGLVGLYRCGIAGPASACCGGSGRL